MVVFCVCITTVRVQISFSPVPKLLSPFKIKDSQR